MARRDGAHAMAANVIAVVGMTLMAVSLVAGLLTLDVPWPERAWGPRFGLFPASSAIIAIGWLLVRRVPGNRVGWLLTIAGFVGSVNYAALMLALLATREGMVGLGQALGLAVELTWPTITTLLLLALARFPHGHRAPGKAAAVVEFLVPIAIVSLAINATLSPAPMENTGYLKPSFLPSVPVDSQGLLDALQMPFAAATLLAGWVVVVNYRRSSGLARQQFRWAAYAGTLFLCSFVLAIPALASDSEFWFDLVAMTNSLFMSLTFVAIGVAILRFRLYDLDRLVGRTLTYLGLTGALVGVYALGVVAIGAGLRGLLGGSTDTMAVALSTLVAVMLFAPMRRRLQDVIDRRLYRRRYDARQEVEALGARLVEEVEVDAVVSQALTVLERTLQPATVAVWVPGPVSEAPTTSLANARNTP